MKKSIVIVIRILLLSFGVFSCGNSSYVDEEGDVTNETETTEVPSEELSKDIETTVELGNDGKLVVIAKNKNVTTIDLEIEVEFYDAEGLIAGSDNENFTAIAPGQEVAYGFYDTPESFDTYKLYTDAYVSEEKSFTSKVDISTNDTGEEIVAQVINNSDSKVDYIEVGVVYYLGDKIVASDDSIESDISPGRAANYNFNYPYNIDFDHWTVYINSAYSYVY